MTPQSNFMVLAPIDPTREDELRSLLASMNLEPGVVNPQNTVLPFGELSNLHFARIVILKDDTLDDPDLLPPPNEVAAEVVESLEAALASFRSVAAKLQGV